MSGVPAYLAGWEERAIEALAPIAALRAVVHFPFFANTLPLGFHYRQALLTAGATPKECRDFVRLYEWGQQRDIIRGAGTTVPTLCYASRREVSSLKRARVDIMQVEIATYKPQWIFTEMSLVVWRLRSKLAASCAAPAKVPFVKIVPELMKMFVHFEVFTDIKAQATALLKPVLWSDERPTRTCTYLCPGDTSTLFEDEHLSNSTLRLFFYGAPMTHYFLKKHSRYIPFQIGPQAATENSFRTVVAIVGDKAAAARAQTVVRRYHRLLFDAAASESGGDATGKFRALQHFYNRSARLLAHRSSFSSSCDYADCISQHRK